MPQHENFKLACDEIARTYESLGHKLGWRFLTGPSSTFSESQEILLLTLNPAGDRDYPEHPRKSCESGSAYIVESWDDRPAGTAKLQDQIRSLFSELAERIDGISGDALLERSLSAHFVPFRSPSLDELHEKERSIAFSRKLWADIFRLVRPKILIVLSREAYDALVEIETHIQSEQPNVDSLPVGWGSYTATIATFSNGPVICRFPHLSRFAVFGRQKSAAQIGKIMDLIAAHYRDNMTSGRNEDCPTADAPVPNIVHKKMVLSGMKKIYIVSQPGKPFRDGTARSRAWLLLRAFDGLSVEQFIKACAVMERASQTGGDPEGWVKFFTATGRYHDRPGNPNASEKLAEVR